MEEEYPICPMCMGYIPNNLTPGAYPGALSRKDNKTIICSECGELEALKDYISYLEREEQNRAGFN